MDIATMPKLTLKSYSRIDNLIPLEKLTLVTGLPGTGKRYSILKFLNKHNITPIYINLDESDIGDLKCDMYGSDFIDPLFRGKISGIKDRVIIIDTYQRIKDIYNIDPTNVTQTKEITEKLESLCCDGNTVIIIAHPEDYVGKDSIFKDNPTLVRNCFEHLHFDSILPRGKTDTGISYRMFVKKGRGIGGTSIHENWLRN